MSKLRQYGFFVQSCCPGPDSVDYIATAGPEKDLKTILKMWNFDSNGTRQTESADALSNAANPLRAGGLLRHLCASGSLSECSREWAQEHFLDLFIGLVALLVVSAAGAVRYVLIDYRK